MEQVPLEEGGDLEVLHLPKRRHLPEPRGQARLQALGGVAALSSPGEHVAVEEREEPRRIGEAKAVAVERVAGIGQALAVEADEEGAGALQVLADEGVQPREEKRAQLDSGSRAQKWRTAFSRKRS